MLHPAHTSHRLGTLHWPTSISVACIGDSVVGNETLFFHGSIAGPEAASSPVNEDKVTC